MPAVPGMIGPSPAKSVAVTEVPGVTVVVVSLVHDGQGRGAVFPIVLELGCFVFRDVKRINPSTTEIDVRSTSLFRESGSFRLYGLVGDSSLGGSGVHAVLEPLVPGRLGILRNRSARCKHQRCRNNQCQMLFHILLSY